MKKNILIPIGLVAALAVAIALIPTPARHDRIVERTNGGVADETTPAQPVTPLPAENAAPKAPEANAQPQTKAPANGATRVAKRVEPSDDWMNAGGMPLKLPNETTGSSFESSGGSSGLGAPAHQDVPGQKIWSTR